MVIDGNTTVPSDAQINSERGCLTITASKTDVIDLTEGENINDNQKSAHLRRSKRGDPAEIPVATSCLPNETLRSIIATAAPARTTEEPSFNSRQRAHLRPETLKGVKHPNSGKNMLVDRVKQLKFRIYELEAEYSVVIGRGVAVENAHGVRDGASAGAQPDTSSASRGGSCGGQGNGLPKKMGDEPRSMTAVIARSAEIAGILAL